jgi:hypothetical protein
MCTAFEALDWPRPNDGGMGCQNDVT